MNLKQHLTWNCKVNAKNFRFVGHSRMPFVVSFFSVSRHTCSTFHLSLSLTLLFTRTLTKNLLLEEKEEANWYDQLATEKQTANCSLGSLDWILINLSNLLLPSSSSFLLFFLSSSSSSVCRCFAYLWSFNEYDQFVVLRKTNFFLNFSSVNTNRVNNKPTLSSFLSFRLLLTFCLSSISLPTALIATLQL